MVNGRRSPKWGFLEGMDIGTDGDPYLDRLRIINTPFFNLYLHHIHRADLERSGHDHPWSFLSIVLSGAYKEEVWPYKECPGYSREFTRKRFSIHKMGQSSAHTITSIYGILWTLVITGPRRSDWGFYPNGKFIHWKDYESGQ
jgi:hypothetical protein